jgi:hypothetical protein
MIDDLERRKCLDEPGLDEPGFNKQGLRALSIIGAEQQKNTSAKSCPKTSK